MQNLNEANVFIHPTAIVESGAEIGSGSKIWLHCHIRNTAKLESNVSLGDGVYVDSGVTVGTNSRVQNGVSLYSGLQIAPWCFIGPHAVFTNDISPRAGLLKWEIVNTNLELGMSIGAGAIIRCGVTIGSFAMVGAGAIVTKSIRPFHLAIGFPAVERSMICACGKTILPLNSRKRDLVRDCCRSRLPEQLLVLAAEAAEAAEHELFTEEVDDLCEGRMA